MAKIPDKEPDRWGTGMEHHPRSVELVEYLAVIDLKHYSDYFCWKYGGDGDNGETLAYEMDSFFEQESEEIVLLRAENENLKREVIRLTDVYNESTRLRIRENEQTAEQIKRARAAEDRAKLMEFERDGAI